MCMIMTGQPENEVCADSQKTPGSRRMFSGVFQLLLIGISTSSAMNH